MRSGQRSALGKRIIDLLDTLVIERAILAGYDWGRPASCVASALWPGRVAGLASYAGYDMIDVERLRHADQPDLEHVVWYQHHFQHNRGKECLSLHRRERKRCCGVNGRPPRPSITTFDQIAISLQNPNFVDVVIHSYRLDFGLARGDPTRPDLEERLAQKPLMEVPAITIDGPQDPRVTLKFSTAYPSSLADVPCLFYITIVQRKKSIHRLTARCPLLRTLTVRIIIEMWTGSCKLKH